MAKATYLEDMDDKRVGVAFWCPGCDTAHSINFSWHFNDDLERPTISPSIKVSYSPTDFDMPGGVCHSFVENGAIRFLDDCTHHLRGQTVELPEWED